jgi:DNA-binding HxlR family transcriptional regulator
MQLLSKRWNGLIIYQLLLGPQRFSEIESKLPISGKLLSERLKELEKVGLIDRKIYADVVPIKVEYSLTEMGQKLQPVIAAIQKWSAEWIR